MLPPGSRGCRCPHGGSTMGALSPRPPRSTGPPPPATTVSLDLSGIIMETNRKFFPAPERKFPNSPKTGGRLDRPVAPRSSPVPQLPARPEPRGSAQTRPLAAGHACAGACAGREPLGGEHRGSPGLRQRQEGARVPTSHLGCQRRDPVPTSSSARPVTSRCRRHRLCYHTRLSW